MVFAEGNENLGTFRMSEFSLSPRLRVVEPGQSGFEIRQTWLGFEWLKDESLRGQMWLGSAELYQRPIWYTPQSNPDFGMVEAWLEGKSVYGDMRAGLLNVHQGFEGINPEWAWVLPQSRMRRNGWLVQRDFGVQFRWHYQSILTELTIHNGEAGANQDGKMWTSGLWQVKNSWGYGALVTASVGNTTPDSTKNAIANTRDGLVFDPNQPAKIRYGSFAIFKDTERRLMLLEAGRGDIFQGDTKSSYAWGRADFSFNLLGDLFLLLRYEQTQADLKDSTTIVKSGSYGFSVVSDDRLQSLTLLGTHHEEDPRKDNDEFLLIFRLNSRYVP